MSDKRPIAFELNGTPVRVWAFPFQTVLDVLRAEAGATEVKYGCGEGVCGTCTVLLDGESVNACLLLAPQIEGRRLTTVRGLAPVGGLHPLQDAFLAHGGAQCGFCTPGMLLAATELAGLATQAGEPLDRDAIRRGLSGNLCRCTGYAKILDAVQAWVAGGAAGARGQGATRDG